jgi:uncharacterized membrane protein (GlpM family)
MELIFRFIVGGFVVSLFAVLGDILRPRSFAGLFGAAPSIAVATLSLTILSEGKLYAATESRSMILGAVALFAYAVIVIQLIIKFKLHAASASISAIPMWLLCAVGTWLLLMR